MMAAVEAVPKKLNAHQVELINHIWNELTRIFGEKEARAPDFLKNYINYPDGRLKQTWELARKLQELKEIECLLPGEQGK